MRTVEGFFTLKKRRRMMDKMEFIPLDELWKKYPNKFFAIVLAAKKARLIARKAREEGKHLPEKPTIMALKEVLKGNVEYTFTSRETKVKTDISIEDEDSTGDYE